MDMNDLNVQFFIFCLLNTFASGLMFCSTMIDTTLCSSIRLLSHSNCAWLYPDVSTTNAKLNYSSRIIGVFYYISNFNH